MATIIGHRVDGPRGSYVAFDLALYEKQGIDPAACTISAPGHVEDVRADLCRAIDAVFAAHTRPARYGFDTIDMTDHEHVWYATLMSCLPKLSIGQ